MPAQSGAAAAGRSTGVPGPHHAELADDALVAGLAVEDADAATAFVRRFQAEGVRPRPGGHPRSGAGRRCRPGGVPAGVALGVDVRQRARLGRRVAADDHPQRGHRRRAGPPVDAGGRRRARPAAAVDARRRRPRRRHGRGGGDQRRGGAGRRPAAGAAREQARAVVLAVFGGCTAEEIGRREACRSARRRRGSAPGCAGCGQAEAPDGDDERRTTAEGGRRREPGRLTTNTSATTSSTWCSATVDGDRRAAMAAHVLRCAACRSEYDELAATVEDLLPAVPACSRRSGSTSGVLARLGVAGRADGRRIVAGAGRGSPPPRPSSSPCSCRSASGGVAPRRAATRRRGRDAAPVHDGAPVGTVSLSDVDGDAGRWSSPSSTPRRTSSYYCRIRFADGTTVDSESVAAGNGAWIVPLPTDADVTTSRSSPPAPRRSGPRPVHLGASASERVRLECPAGSRLRRSDGRSTRMWAAQRSIAWTVRDVVGVGRRLVRAVAADAGEAQGDAARVAGRGLHAVEGDLDDELGPDVHDVAGLGADRELPAARSVCQRSSSSVRPLNVLPTITNVAVVAAGAEVEVRQPARCAGRGPTRRRARRGRACGPA